MNTEAPLVIITDRVPDFLIEKLQQRNFEVQYLPDITVEEMHEKIALAEGLILTTKIKIDIAFCKIKFVLVIR